MNIALILTGGTICSRTAADGTRRSDVGSAVTVLEQGYRATQPHSTVQFNVQMPLDRLSEDLTPDDWCILLRALFSLDYGTTDGVVIAHGTDTLSQTAGMLAAALVGVPVPVILVSAIAPLGDPRTNGHANFAAAVGLIERKLAPGVWAVYENADGIMYLHRGFELLPCQWGSTSFFSAGMIPAAELQTAPAEKALPKPEFFPVGAPPQVLLLRPYNGLRYDNIPLENIAAVIHGTYHSETANSVKNSPYSVLNLLKRCRENGIPCFLTPCRAESQDYGSGYDLLRAGAVPLGNMTVFFAYGAVWLSALQGYSGDALVRRIEEIRQCCESQSFRCFM